MANHTVSKLASIALVALSTGTCADARLGEEAQELSLSSTLNHEGPLSLKAARGKIVLLEFWATWCPPCRQSIPHLQGLHEKYGNKGLKIISVSTEPREHVAAFVKEMGGKMTYPIGLDTDSKTAEAYGVEGIPSAFLIDPKGRIIWRGHPLNLDDGLIESALKKVAKK